MKKKTALSIPLVVFSSPLFEQMRSWKNDWLQPRFFPHIQIPDEPGPLDGCYAVKIEDGSMAPVLRAGMVAVFSTLPNQKPAEFSIYCVGRVGGRPLIRKVVKNETEISGAKESNLEDKSLFNRKAVRKSFMTPTPLHIPGSRVSPIAESTHQMIYLKSTTDSEAMTLIPAEKLLWMHPLVLILKPGEYRL